MKIAKYLAMNCLLWVCCLFSYVVSGSSLLELKVDSEVPLSVSVLEGGKSFSLLLPVDFMHEIEGLYDAVYVEDISGREVGGIVFRLEGGDVNSCSRVLIYDKRKRSLDEWVFEGGELCSHKIQGGYIISSYRKGGEWNEDVYRVEGAKAKRILSDSCIGCSEIKRKKYGADGLITRLLVSDHVDFEKRIPLISRVVTPHAGVFVSPDSIQATKDTLARGDEVALIGFGYSKIGEEWFEFRFSKGTVNIEGWLRCSDLEVCEEKK